MARGETFHRRAVELVLSDGWNAAVGPHHPKGQQAIGYLSQFYLTVAPRCRITGGADGYLEATYYKPDGSVCYVIGAVWCDGNYSYHS